MNMMRSLAVVPVLLLAVTAAPGQVSRIPPDPSTCDCSATVVVNADGVLNMRHCNATSVLAVLDRYAGQTARLLPESTQSIDLQLLPRKLEAERRETVRLLLQLMTSDELGRLLPFVRNSDGPDLGAGVHHGTWTGQNLFTCGSAVYWINAGLDRVAQVSTILLNLHLEAGMYATNPGQFCDPNFLSDSPYFGESELRFGEAWDWLQTAADFMSSGIPAFASSASYLAWWRSFQGSLGFVVAHTQPPISGDDRCEKVANAGLALAEVGAAARQAYEQADACSQSQ